MNPLSPFTYYRRHKGQALLLLALIGALTLGVFLLVGSMLTATTSSLNAYNHLTRMSRIVACQALDAGSVAQIRAHPDVAAMLPENGFSISFPVVATSLDSRPILGVNENDLGTVMATCHLRLKEGRPIEPRAADIVLSQEISRALDLQIGDVISYEIDERFYPAVATELTLVGTLESIPSATEPIILAGFVSYEYIAAHERYQPRWSNLLIIPRPGRIAAANDFAKTLVDEGIGPNPVRLETFEGETATLRQLVKVSYGIWSFAAGIVAVSAALVVGMVNQIAIARRLPELGLLHATGHKKRELVRRLVLEIAAITGIGWGFGLLLSVGCSHLLNSMPLASIGPAINLGLPSLYIYPLPIPLVVVGWVAISAHRVLNKLDAVAIVERDKLSMEDSGGRRGRWRPAHSAAHLSPNPLSSRTFYLRHRRRSLALLLSTGLIVLSVAFPPFIFTMMIDAGWPLVLSYVSHTSLVSPAPAYQTVEPSVLAQIRAHPAVAHVIPVKALTMMARVIPFEFRQPVYGVREEDLQTLLDVYGLYVGEGAIRSDRCDERPGPEPGLACRRHGG